MLKSCLVGVVSVAVVCCCFANEFIATEINGSEELEALAFKYGPDKSKDDHKYTDFYATLFDPIKSSVENILEVGIAAGQSLQLWNGYFPNAIIYGVDIRIDGRTFTALHDLDRVYYLFSNCQNESAVMRLPIQNHSMDIIIDDGPHEVEAQQKTLQHFWRFLKPGGYYVIEDVDFTNSSSQMFEDREELLDNFTRRVFEENAVFLVDTAVGHRCWDEYRQHSPTKTLTRKHHNSYLLVIHKHVDNRKGNTHTPSNGGASGAGDDNSSRGNRGDSFDSSDSDSRQRNCGAQRVIDSAYSDFAVPDGGRLVSQLLEQVPHHKLQQDSWPQRVLKSFPERRKLYQYQQQHYHHQQYDHQSLHKATLAPFPSSQRETIQPQASFGDFECCETRFRENIMDDAGCVDESAVLTCLARRYGVEDILGRRGFKFSDFYTTLFSSTVTRNSSLSKEITTEASSSTADGPVRRGSQEVSARVRPLRLTVRRVLLVMDGGRTSSVSSDTDSGLRSESKLVYGNLTNVWIDYFACAAVHVVDAAQLLQRTAQSGDESGSREASTGMKTDEINQNGAGTGTNAEGGAGGGTSTAGPCVLGRKRAAWLSADDFLGHQAAAAAAAAVGGGGGGGASNTYDLVIDLGRTEMHPTSSRASALQQQATLSTLWRYVRPGGLYVAERISKWDPLPSPVVADSHSSSSSSSSRKDTSSIGSSGSSAGLQAAPTSLFHEQQELLSLPVQRILQQNLAYLVNTAAAGHPALLPWMRRRVSLHGTGRSEEMRSRGASSSSTTTSTSSSSGSGSDRNTPHDSYLLILRKRIGPQPPILINSGTIAMRAHRLVVD
jgi:SAM-dependent methyltransferase